MQRRSFLRLALSSLWLVAAGALAPALARALRRKHPDDLPPIPWIGHC
jgi:hypothetical protein